MRYKSNLEVDHVIYEQIRQDMSTYPNLITHLDGTETFRRVNSSYFLLSDQWRLDKMNAINQFRSRIEDFKTEKSRKTIYFDFDNETLNLEVKYVYFKRILNHNWKISTVFQSLQNPLKRLTEFINEEYPTLTSLLQLKIDKAEQEYINWLKEKGIRTKRVKNHLLFNDVTINTSVVAILRMLHREFTNLIYQQEEWRKDIWDVRKLNKAYGIKYNPTNTSYYLNFNKIKQEDIRLEVKKYFRQRLISKHKFAWSTSIGYLNVLVKFFKHIFTTEPDWISIKNLKRSHIESYIHYLHEHANQFKHQNSNPEGYIISSLRILRKYIKDLQRYQYHGAPKTDVNLLIFPEDIPKPRLRSYTDIDYIPDYVLKQFLSHISDLHGDVFPVIMVAFKTGLRISDVLTLRLDCLVKIEGKFWIETSIQKSRVKGHRIPIDDELASMLSDVIKQSDLNTYNNPNGYIFNRNHGSRQGKPMDQSFIRLKLNEYSIRNNIRDESGQMFNFKPHQFRHTFAVKLINGGADIVTVQDLLGHAYPDMTLRYAKLLDQTKRKVFDSIVKQGAFDIN